MSPCSPVIQLFLGYLLFQMRIFVNVLNCEIGMWLEVLAAPGNPASTPPIELRAERGRERGDKSAQAPVHPLVQVAVPSESAVPMATERTALQAAAILCGRGFSALVESRFPMERRRSFLMLNLYHLPPGTRN